jgi:hypothetical protein
MINNAAIDKAFADLRSICGGVRDDYFGLLYIEREYKVQRESAINQVAFGNNDYGVDGFYFDEQRRNLYIFQFKNSNSPALFRSSLQRLIDAGVNRIFATPNQDDHKNQVLLQLRSCLQENRNIIDQVCFRFVFQGDTEEAEKSQVLNKLREDLEEKKYLIDHYFHGRDVRMVVDFRSANGRIATFASPSHTASFPVPLVNLVEIGGSSDERMYIGLIGLMDLHGIYKDLGTRFFDSNIRYGLGEDGAVNRSISRSLRRIVIEQSELPVYFTFNHNGITLYAEEIKPNGSEGCYRISAPRLLNGAQTVTTVAKFLESNKDSLKFKEGRPLLDEVKVVCRVITNAKQDFVTRVTINNNRQNPVEPWNLHANDMIQLELQDKFRRELNIYYERQERAFNQLSLEDLEESGITEVNKAIQMLKLTQTFLLTDGQISRLSEMRVVFEEDKPYEQVFRKERLEADSSHIVLCYKVQFRLRKLIEDIRLIGQNKYQFLPRARLLIWALMCQALLNDPNLDGIARKYGKDMIMPTDFVILLTRLATAKVRFLVKELMDDPEYLDKVADENYSFLRSDRAFDKCMDIAKERWGWTHRKLQ